MRLELIMQPLRRVQALRAFLAAPAQRERRSRAAQELSLDHVLLIEVRRIHIVARQKRGQNCLKLGRHSHSQPPTKMARALESLRTDLLKVSTGGECCAHARKKWEGGKVFWSETARVRTTSGRPRPHFQTQHVHLPPFRMVGWGHFLQQHGAPSAGRAPGPHPPGLERHRADGQPARPSGWSRAWPAS